MIILSSRSATVLVIFTVACIAFCLASVFGAMTGPISILPNDTDGNLLDNISGNSDDSSNNVNHDNSNSYSPSNDNSHSDDSNVETTTDTGGSGSGGSSSGGSSSSPNVETTTG